MVANPAVVLLAPFLPVFALAAGFLTLSLSALAVLAARLKNAGIVDVFWGFGFIPMGWIGACNLDGFWLRKAVLLTMIMLACLRLGSYLLKRCVQLHPEEDPRYHVLRDLWGTRADWGFWGVFLLQGVLILILSGVFWVPMQNAHPVLRVSEWLGAGLWLIGYLGEGFSDAQLDRFKREPSNRGQVCQEGLWRYSRHPNYFFQWVQWLGYFAFALASPLGLGTVYAPLLMLYLLTCVSGVPPTEAHLSVSKGEAYKRYQQTTSAFVPWFPQPIGNE